MSYSPQSWLLLLHNNNSWRPQLSFLGARDIDIDREHYVTLNFDSLEAYGVTPELKASLDLQHSAIFIMSVSATFRSPMAFSAFPFDSQTLAFRFTDFHNAVGYDFLPLAGNNCYKLLALRLSLSLLLSLFSLLVAMSQNLCHRNAVSITIIIIITIITPISNESESVH